MTLAVMYKRIFILDVFLIIPSINAINIGLFNKFNKFARFSDMIFLYFKNFYILQN